MRDRRQMYGVCIIYFQHQVECEFRNDGHLAFEATKKSSRSFADRGIVPQKPTNIP